MIELLKILSCLIIGGLIFLLILSHFKYAELKKTGLKYIKPVPIFGNLWDLLCGKENIGETLKKITDEFPEERYVGFIEFLNTSVLIKDLELANQILVKDFDKFHDLPISIDENADPVFGRWLKALKGQKWRRSRNNLTPVFTKERIKNMFSFMSECSALMVDFYEKEIKKASPIDRSMEVDVSDFSSRYVIDVMASSAFGYHINSLTEQNNEFYKKALKLGKQNFWFIIKLYGFRIYSKLMKFFGICMLPNRTVDFFRRLLIETLHFREETGEYRTDLIQIYLSIKDGMIEDGETPESKFPIEMPTTINKWTVNDWIAQVIIFILDGQETSSQTISFLLYELAMNEEIQERLRDEIENILIKRAGRAEYKDITDLRFLDMVVLETLRKWPPIPIISREATKFYNLGPINKSSLKSYMVKGGDAVYISPYVIQRDPENWPNPDVFDPERFSEENKSKIKPTAFIPFGIGPRNCIGSEFALLEIKSIVFFLLAKFSFETCPNTTTPIKLEGSSFFLNSSHGIHLKMKLNKNSRLYINLPEKD